MTKASDSKISGTGASASAEQVLTSSSKRGRGAAVDALCLECGMSRSVTLATFWNSPGAHERDLHCSECRRTTVHGRVWRESSVGQFGLEERRARHGGEIPRGRDWREESNADAAARSMAELRVLEASEHMLAVLGVRVEYRALRKDVIGGASWCSGPAGDWWLVSISESLTLNERRRTLALIWSQLLPCVNGSWLTDEWVDDSKTPDLRRKDYHWKRPALEAWGP